MGAGEGDGPSRLGDDDRQTLTVFSSPCGLLGEAVPSPWPLPVNSEEASSGDPSGKAGMIDPKTRCQVMGASEEPEARVVYCRLYAVGAA